jgi:hypothetical protein
MRTENVRHVEDGDPFGVSRCAEIEEERKRVQGSRGVFKKGHVAFSRSGKAASESLGVSLQRQDTGGDYTGAVTLGRRRRPTWQEYERGGTSRSRAAGTSRRRRLQVLSRGDGGGDSRREADAGTFTGKWQAGETIREHDVSSIQIRSPLCMDRLSGHLTPSGVASGSSSKLAARVQPSAHTRLAASAPHDTRFSDLIAQQLGFRRVL